MHLGAKEVKEVDETKEVHGIKLKSKSDSGETMTLICQIQMMDKN